MEFSRLEVGIWVTEEEPRPATRERDPQATRPSTRDPRTEERTPPPRAPGRVVDGVVVVGRERRGVLRFSGSDVLSENEGVINYLYVCIITNQSSVKMK
jgi:hypothetical protein